MWRADEIFRSCMTPGAMGESSWPNSCGTTRINSNFAGIETRTDRTADERLPDSIQLNCGRYAKRMKLTDYVAGFLARQGIRHAFVVSGGASLHLIHSIFEQPGIEHICPQHEQAGAMAADAY